MAGVLQNHHRSGLASRLHEVLACPRDGGPLRPEAAQLVCAAGHAYPIVYGVPILRVDADVATIVAASLAQRVPEHWPQRFARSPLFVELLNFGPGENAAILASAAADSPVDGVVSHLVGRTCGYLYVERVGRLERYPVPPFPMGEVQDGLLLDVGCGWGRWSLAAAAAGHRVIGLDWSLGAIMAARRVAEQLGLKVDFVCGDARALPFRANVFDRVFSYSVLQHLSKPDARSAIAEIGRTLRPGGTSLVEMANAWGLRSFYHRGRRGFREGDGRDVRYWSPGSLRRVFGDAVGRSELRADAFGGLNLQASDAPHLSLGGRAAIYVSELLKRTTPMLKPLTLLADSLFIISQKADA